MNYRRDPFRSCPCYGNDRLTELKYKKSNACKRHQKNQGKEYPGQDNIRKEAIQDMLEKRVNTLFLDSLLILWFLEELNGTI